MAFFACQYPDRDQREVRRSQSIDQRLALQIGPSTFDRMDASPASSPAVSPSVSNAASAKRADSKRVMGGPRPHYPRSSTGRQVKHRPTVSLPPEFVLPKMRSSPDLMMTAGSSRSPAKERALPTPTSALSASSERPLRRLPDLPFSPASSVASPSFTAFCSPVRSPTNASTLSPRTPLTSTLNTYTPNSPWLADQGARLSPKPCPSTSSYRDRNRPSPSRAGYGSDSSTSRLSVAPLDMKRLLSKPAQPSPNPSPNRQSFRLVGKGSSSEMEFAPGPEDSSDSGSRQHDRQRKYRQNTRRSPLVTDGQILQKHSPQPVPDSSLSSVRIDTKSKSDDRSLLSKHNPNMHTVPGRKSVNDLKASKRPSRPNLKVSEPSSPRRKTAPSHSRSQSFRTTETLSLTILTPAASVALAYKQQEQRREEIAQSALTPLNSPRFPPPDQSRQRGKLPYESDETMNEGGKDTLPAYAVVGSDRLVPVRTPVDKVDIMYYSEPDRDRAASAGSTTGAKGISRKLTRNRSGRWRNGRDVVANGTISGADTAPSEGHDGILKSWMLPRPSLQEKRPVSRPVQAKASLRLSFDDFVQVKTSSGHQSFADVPKRSADANDAKEKAKKEKDREERSSKSAIWRLVKRISSNALRDSRNRREVFETPPPVPAIPKELLPIVRTRTQSEKSQPIEDGRRASEQNGLLRSLPRSSSTRNGRPSTAPARPGPRPPMSPSHLTVGSTRHPRNRLASANSNATRPSDTTRSSSPLSTSDLASMRFHRTHSPRSSMSSYGEILPHTEPAKALISQHTVPSNELFKLSQGQEEERRRVPSSAMRIAVPTRPKLPDGFGPASATDAQTSLPYPPRPVGSGTFVAAAGDTTVVHVEAEEPLPTSQSFSLSSQSSQSPLIPTFQITNTVNSFPPSRKSESHTPVESACPYPPLASAFGPSIMCADPPPRPERSPRRDPTAIKVSPTSRLPNTSSDSPVTPVSSKSTPDKGSARASPVSSSRGPRRAVTSASSGVTRKHKMSSSVTFRDMSESWKHTWTDKEKSDKWNDLLQRSEKAGGTIRVDLGAQQGLLSDAVRDSVITESHRDSMVSEV